ncbi:MAG TPA: surface-adhesin E family protein [Pyrinomonadaceae bacterium]|nr:surface-adhesin E family protein [Pyrinomonadaceae bacterium]
MKVLILALLIVAPAFGQSDGKKIEKWTPIAWGKDDLRVMHFAPETIRRNEDKVSGWTRFDFPNGSAVALPGTDFGSIRLFLVFDCAHNRAYSYEALLYDRNGKFLKKHNDNSSIEEKPGTLSWAAFEYLCERRTSFPTGPPVLKPKT